MAVLNIKKEERSKLSPQMALLNQRWQQIRQLELGSVQSNPLANVIHVQFTRKKEYSAA